MEPYLVFKPVYELHALIVGMEVVGTVRAQTAEHAIRVAKTKGFLNPIVGPKQ